MVTSGRFFSSQFTLTETLAPYIQRGPSAPAGPTTSDGTEGPTVAGVCVGGNNWVFFWTDIGLQNLPENQEACASVTSKFQKNCI